MFTDDAADRHRQRSKRLFPFSERGLWCLWLQSPRNRGGRADTVDGHSVWSAASAAAVAAAVAVAYWLLQQQQAA